MADNGAKILEFGCLFQQFTIVANDAIGLEFTFHTICFLVVELHASVVQTRFLRSLGFGYQGRRHLRKKSDHGWSHCMSAGTAII